jgi:L-asparaginase / beta-aspartyl-peptidase
VKNPSRVARAVVDTPHRILAGEGATHFARALGFEPFDPKTAAAIDRQRALLSELSEKGAAPSAADVVPWPEEGIGGGPPVAWRAYVERPRVVPNAHVPSAKPTPLEPDAGAEQKLPMPAASDTVAVLIRCAPDRFAGAASAGGPWLSLPGRVGDVPIPGGALYVGAKGAVFVTGPGEVILTRLLAKSVYDQLSSTGSAQTTLAWALSELPKDELAVTILDAEHALLGPEARSAWAALDPTLRTSGEAK